MVKFNLAVLLAKKKLKQSDLVRITGIRYMTINEIYNEFAERISLEHIGKICDALECKVEDLIIYTPKKKNDFK